MKPKGGGGHGRTTRVSSPCLEVAPLSAVRRSVTVSLHLSGSRKGDFDCASVFALSLLVAVVAGGGSTNAGWLGWSRRSLVRRSVSPLWCVRLSLFLILISDLVLIL